MPIRSVFTTESIFMRILLHYVHKAAQVAEFDYESGIQHVLIPAPGDYVHLAYFDDTPYVVKRRLFRHVSEDCMGVLCEIEPCA